MEPAWIIGGLSIALNVVVLIVNQRGRADIAEMKAAFYNELRDYVKRTELQNMGLTYPRRRRENT